MGKPSESLITGVPGKFSGKELAALQASELDEAAYSGEKPRKVEGRTLTLTLPLFGADDNPCLRWMVWHRDDVALPAKQKARPKKSHPEFKDMIPLVRLIAQKIHRPLPANVLLNDLVQDGMIGLIAAFNEHDGDVGVPFRVFAENKIRWAIMDGLRAGDWAGRSVRRRATKVAKTTARLQALLNREPSKKEIADALEVRVDDVASILGDAYGYSFVRINDEVEGDTHDIPDSSMAPHPIIERRQAFMRAMAGMRILSSNERRALILRTLCDLSVLQTAAEMGVSESRVSQLYKRATEKLADYM